jgi:hypothetical protein
MVTTLCTRFALGCGLPRPEWTQIWTPNSLEQPGRGRMDGTVWTHKSWSAAQKHQGANASDGPGQLEVLVGAIPWGFKSPLRHEELLPSPPTAWNEGRNISFASPLMIRRS